MFLDVLLELFRVGNLGIGLDGGQLLVDFAVDIDVEILGFLGQEQLIDAIPQQVLSRVRLTAFPVRRPPRRWRAGSR